MERRRRQGGDSRRLAATYARRRRLLLITVVCVWGGIWARAFQLQVLHKEDLALAVDDQSGRLVTLTAPRGDIVDREGRLLALNVARQSFFAYPNRETSAYTLASKFASVRNTSRNTLSKRWKKRDDQFTWLMRRCDATLAERIEKWGVPGVHVTWEHDRDYPYANQQAIGPLGFVDADMKGAAGLERFYDDMLRGTDGEGVLIADAVGRRYRIDPVAGRRPVPGAQLRLTIDGWWQSILSEELTHAVDKWNANSGMAMLMDPHTGAIQALVEVDGRGSAIRPVKNRIVSDVFEPGSTFKLVSFAAAISDGAVRLGEYFDGGDGVGVFSGRTIRDDKKHGVLSVAEGFSLSSNVVTGKIANKLAPQRLDYWVRQFGFGEPTGIDLPGESGGRIAVQPRSDFNIAQRSIGHGISVTPVQLARAYAAVANGGFLVQPHLVDAVEMPDGSTQRTKHHSERVIEPDVALVMQKLMSDVVKNGTAKLIWDAQFPIAGKTGTAEKPDPETGTYDKTKYIASFVGFYPADQPRLLGVVVLDEPKRIHYGGYTAAPVLLNTIKRGERQRSQWAQSGRDTNDGDDTIARRDNWSRRLVDAVAPWIVPTEVHANESVTLFDGDANSSEPTSTFGGETNWDRLKAYSSDEYPPAVADSTVWPSLIGRPLRDALAELRARGLSVTYSGTGCVTDQHPAATTRIKGDRTCRLALR